MRWGLIIFGATIQMVMLAPSVHAESELDIAKRAIIREICFSSFWAQNDVYRLGVDVPIQYKSANGEIYVWSDKLWKLSKWEKHARVIPPLRQFDIFRVTVQGDKGLADKSVGQNFSYIVTVPGGDAGFKMQVAALPGVMRADHLQVPSDCTPHPEPVSPWKEQAIGKILDAVKGDAKWFGWHGHPADLQVVISDFDWDYSFLYVYVPSLNQSLTIATRSGSSDPKNITDWQDLFVEVNPKEVTGSLKKRILEYGVTRTIHWDGQ